MLGLKGRKDLFRILLPKTFLVPQIEEKYAKILRTRKGFYITPIDFLNETIQGVQVLGFQNATIQQQQSSRGKRPMMDELRKKENNFRYPGTDYNYRSPVPPIALTDRTVNIIFRHTLGYLNYFMLFENFWYIFSRDMKYKDILHELTVDIFNEYGSIYAQIVLKDPLIDGMDMLDLSYTEPIANSETFKIDIKYSNFDFQFISDDESLEPKIILDGE